ncbi:MAG TPA: metallophosphoesterase [Capsulimonadaceae bacterium]
MSNPLKAAVTGLVTAGAACFAYATCVEPYAIELVEFDLLCPRLPKAFDGLTILQISDLHMRQFGRRERKIAAMASGLRPDIIALTGDLVHTSGGIVPFLKMAKSFQANVGMYAIYGNSEHKNGILGSRLAKTLTANGIVPLLNAHITVKRGESEIAVCGTDDPVTEHDDLEAACAGIATETFKLLLMHTPDNIGEAAHLGIDVVLSGHTHGGQVRAPFYGPPYTRSILGRRMNAGYYGGRSLMGITGRRNGSTQLYVSRGVGASGLALRFLCRPEVTFVTLRSL